MNIEALTQQVTLNDDIVQGSLSFWRKVRADTLFLQLLVEAQAVKADWEARVRHRIEDTKRGFPQCFDFDDPPRSLPLGMPIPADGPEDP